MRICTWFGSEGLDVSLRSGASKFIHKYLGVPYTLNVHEFHSPKRPRETIVFLHGIGNTLHSWDEVVKGLPKDVRVIGIDLLGFGKSPRPEWAKYDAKTQARSVGITLLSMRLARQPIIVGHSLGALVAVHVARRYSLLSKRLILCSPPFYGPELLPGKIKSPDDMLRKIYQIAKKQPEQLVKFAPLAVKLGLANKSLNITDDTIGSYIGALEASIINQTALDDIQRLRMPIDIFYGTFDPVVIKKHITALGKERQSISVIRVPYGHEVVGGYAKRLATHISDLTG